MRALVTGATGFIGRAVAHRLLDEGWDVVVLARSPGKAGALAERGAVVARGDVTEPATLAGPLEGADVCLHIAAWYELGVTDRARMEAINVEGTRNVLRAAGDAGVARIVHCSSVAALGSDPSRGIGDESRVHPGRYGSLYEETKHRAHLVAREMAAEGLPVVTVMPTATYGPGDHSMAGVLLNLYARRLLVACPFQDTGLSWVHVEDVGAGMVAAAERGAPAESYVLGGDNETIGGLFRRVARLVGIKPPRRLPDPVLRAARPLEPVLGRLFGQGPRLLTEGLASLRGAWWFSSAKADRALGYSFRKIEEGIPPTVAALRRR